MTTQARRREVDHAGAAGPHSVSRSHVGLVRQINEDRVLDAAEARLWAVIDGMGGHRGGDLAAQSVIGALRTAIAQHPAIDFGQACRALETANAAIVARNETLGLEAGATVVLAALDRDLLRIAWAGDSRAYLWRDGVATLLTHDHSVVQELVDAGLIDAEAAQYHPQANVVTRALGVQATIELETTELRLSPGDRVLLCSDGLSRKLRLDRADRAAALDAQADALLAAALAEDGSDNISLVLIDYPG